MSWGVTWNSRPQALGNVTMDVSITLVEDVVGQLFYLYQNNSQLFQN